MNCGRVNYDWSWYTWNRPVKKYNRNPSWPSSLGWRGGYDVGPLTIRVRYSKDYFHG